MGCAMDVAITTETGVTEVIQPAHNASFNRFHQRWCNSPGYVNETLQKLEIVLVSDPFTKDSEHAAVPDSGQQRRCEIQAIQPDDLSADVKKRTTRTFP
jgi:hypothetical protein